MTKHIPVLLKETIDSLKFIKTGVFVDATLGGGGHTLALIDKLTEETEEKIKIVAFDHDKKAIQEFEKRILKLGYKKNKEDFVKENVRIILVNENFVNLSESLKGLNIVEVDGVIADLGISTDQLEDMERGFSYHSDKELDLRMDQSLGLKGYDLLNALDKTQLTKMFKEYGDVREAERLAENIIERRKEKPFKKITDLLEIIDKTVYSKYSRRLYARVFQALRITVNSEIINLRNFLPQAFDTLTHGGVMSVITFHSGEDRVVKKFIKKVNKQDNGYDLMIKPTPKEVYENPKSSSAKLRSIMKI